MDIRLLKKKNGELVLQKYVMADTNRWGHAVFGWIEVETVVEHDTEALSPQVNEQ